jgi:hypothetical protein
MSIQQAFEKFEEHQAELDRHASREKLDECEALIGRALQLAREIRQCGRLDVDASEALREAVSFLVPAQAWVGRACVVESGCAAQERYEEFVGGVY